jgi:hypothetical protein
MHGATHIKTKRTVDKYFFSSEDFETGTNNSMVLKSSCSKVKQRLKNFIIYTAHQTL